MQHMFALRINFTHDMCRTAAQRTYKKVLPKLPKDDLRAFACKWVKSIENEEDACKGLTKIAAMISIMRPAAFQWDFTIEATNAARTDESLLAIGKGPMEHLLAMHGEWVGPRVLEKALVHRQFARMLDGVSRRKGQISSALWNEILKARANIFKTNSYLVAKAAELRIQAEQEALKTLKIELERQHRLKQKFP